MCLFLLSSVLICVVLMVAFFIVIRRLATRESTLPATSDWIEELSTERYRPMLRLLDEEELSMLASQRGFGRKELSKIRTERSAIFRGYLRSLSDDFSRICIAIEVLMMQSQQDRPDLAAVLLRHKANFALAIIAVNVRVVLYRLGLGTVEVGSLVDAFDCMRMQLRGLVPARAYREG